MITKSSDCVVFIPCMTVFLNWLYSHGRIVGEFLVFSSIKTMQLLKYLSKTVLGIFLIQ